MQTKLHEVYTDAKTCVVLLRRYLSQVPGAGMTKTEMPRIKVR